MFYCFQPCFDNLLIGFFETHVLLLGLVFHAPILRVRDVHWRNPTAEAVGGCQSTLGVTPIISADGHRDPVICDTLDRH